MTTDDETRGEDVRDLDALIPPGVRAKRAALAACVKRMKAEELKGKARDDAAGHFLAGAFVVMEALGLTPEGFPLPAAVSYTDVLEALAES